MLAGETRIRCVDRAPTNRIPIVSTPVLVFRQTNLIVYGVAMPGITMMEVCAGLAQKARVWPENIVTFVQLALILMLSV